jgi:hypothetical protein
MIFMLKIDGDTFEISKHKKKRVGNIPDPLLSCLFCLAK